MLCYILKFWCLSVFCDFTSRTILLATGNYVLVNHIFNNNVLSVHDSVMYINDDDNNMAFKTHTALLHAQTRVHACILYYIFTSSTFS